MSGRSSFDNECFNSYYSDKKYIIILLCFHSEINSIYTIFGYVFSSLFPHKKRHIIPFQKREIICLQLTDGQLYRYQIWAERPAFVCVRSAICAGSMCIRIIQTIPSCQLSFRIFKLFSADKKSAPPLAGAPFFYAFASSITHVTPMLASACSREP